MRLPSTIAAIAACAFFVACEDSRGRGGGATTPRIDAGRPANDGSANEGGVDDRGINSDASDPRDGSPNPDANADADAGSARDAEEADSGPGDAGIVPFCQQACTVPSDCVASPTALTDDDNYTCTDGHCNYLGCNNTSECQTTFNSPDYVCAQFTTLFLPACVHTCSVAADCVSPSSLFDTDNYACTQGGCEWLGCNDALECRDALQNNNYVCEALAGSGNPNFKNCVLPCSIPGDCGAATSPAYDADNYRCTAQRCEYLGCNNTAECQATFPSGNYVCE